MSAGLAGRLTARAHEAGRRQVRRIIAARQRQCACGADKHGSLVVCHACFKAAPEWARKDIYSGDLELMRAATRELLRVALERKGLL